jgi:hypothetical protein
MSSLSTGSRIAATSTARVNYLSRHRHHEEAEAQADVSMINSDGPLRFINMIISEVERANWDKILFRTSGRSGHRAPAA